MKKKEKTAEDQQWARAAWDMLYLVQCGINSVVPDPERVAQMALEKVYARSKNQSLEALAYMSLESLMKSNAQIQIPDENQVLSQWKEAKDKVIAKMLMMDAAREELFAYLEKQGIWHMALKGVVLCHMYPQYGMRQMADNDILFDSSFRQQVHDWFVQRGYMVESFQVNEHDVYLKNPVYNFEMHTDLFYEGEPPQLIQYYRSIKEKLVQKPGTSFEYYMLDEDFYLYIVAHAYKHYLHKGTGFRSLLDLYVYNRAKSNMDRSYLDHELSQMGLAAFEHEMRELARKALNPENSISALSEKEQTLLKEFIYSGTYGTPQKYWNNKLRKLQPDGSKISAGIKCRYLIRRLFPNRALMEEWCRQYAPFIARHRCLLPLAWVWRIVKRGIQKRRQIREELDTIRKT